MEEVIKTVDRDNTYLFNTFFFTKLLENGKVSSKKRPQYKSGPKPLIFLKKSLS